MSNPPLIDRTSLASDLEILLKASNPLKQLLNPQPPQNNQNHSALILLNEYTPSTNNHDTSQSLAEVYVKDMRGNVLSIDQGEGEKLGARIDEIREKGEGISKALGDVTV